MNRDQLIILRNELMQELTGNILPFWSTNTIDSSRGGFYGYLNYRGEADPDHPKGLVLNARLLWTFSAAYRVYHEEKLLQLAKRAYCYLLEYFRDRENSGFNWAVDCYGKPCNTKKRTYGMAFVLYGLAEYYQATKEQESLNQAISLYKTLEERCRDLKYGGYIEAFERDWASRENMELSEGEPNVKKTMNTHLHILEAYTNLIRVWDDPGLRGRLREVLLLMVKKILNPQTASLQLLFDETWRSQMNLTSFGHDIEASWLLVEAAEVLGDADLLFSVGKIALQIVDQVYERGIDRQYGGLYEEATPGGISNCHKIWWGQAEAVVGFYNAYQLSGKESFLDASVGIWHFITRYLVDRKNGEWFWQTTDAGVPDSNFEKVGFWKCPYHNSRMCLEMLFRLDETLGHSFQ